MRIKRVAIKNFRALRDVSLDFSNTTALIGENNSGKSAFLIALELFFAGAPDVGKNDFSDGEVGEPISITIHFSDLTPYDRTEFESNLINGELIITRQLALPGSQDHGKYFVSALVNPDFSECRNEQSKSKKRTLYSELRKKYGEPDELKSVTNADDIDGHLEAWEDAHPDALKLQKVAGFKGWKNVAVGKLKEKTDFIFIRAVQDASKDIQESKSSPVKSLINTIAKQTIENNLAYQQFLQDANKKIFEFTDPKKVPALAQISSELTAILKNYYRDSEIIANWTAIESIQTAFPTSEIEVKDNEFITSIDGVGHGLQRAIILTVLQYMAERRVKGDDGDGFKEAQSDIVIAIEEPEVYQHPVKQRLFAKVLNNLASTFNPQTGIRIQTIYVTHSPLLVSLPNCDQIRLVRHSGQKKHVRVSSTSLDICSKSSATHYGLKPEDAWSAELMAAKLHTFRGETAEGFFSKCAVLVEGPGDKAILDAWFKVNDRDPHAEGIVVVEAHGKNNLGKPIIIFQELGIPCFWIFDNDKSNSKIQDANKIRENRALQRMAKIDETSCTDFPTGVFDRFAVWDGTIENYVRDVAGKQFDQLAGTISEKYDIPPSDCLKSPAAAAAMLGELCDRKCEFGKLDKICAAIDKLISHA